MNTATFNSKRRGPVELDAEITSVHIDEDEDVHITFQWICSKLGWGEYVLTFTHDGKMYFDDEYMDSENFPFLGALLQSVKNHQEVTHG